LGFTVFRPEDLQFQPPKRGDQRRGIAPISEALHEMRGNVWRLPPGARGTRHVEHAQEELFVVLEGTLTMFLGDPAERVELPRGSVVVVEVGTALQQRNDGDGDVVVLALGAPAVPGQAEHLSDPD
jgi:mannose-6-phosphate isomerase-like protein (cupin superfamily)